MALLSLPREASVCRSQSSLESSGYRVGSEAVELSKPARLQAGRTQRSQSTLGCCYFLRSLKRGHHPRGSPRVKECLSWISPPEKCVMLWKGNHTRNWYIENTHQNFLGRCLIILFRLKQMLLLRSKLSKAYAQPFLTLFLQFGFQKKQMTLIYIYNEKGPTGA